MKKVIVVFLVCILSGLMAIACRRDQSVHAGSESDTYQPRPQAKPAKPVSPDVKGELLRVDLAGKTIAVRVESGMEQTFKFDDNTVLIGLEAQPQASLRNLTGKEGSELTVRWRDENGVKMATTIEVTQVITAKPQTRSKKKR